ncbi:MAG: carbohydrate binding family 9 domain-containing protein [FCB group bacterium]|nr:carbohydrate binding family 9 domain-containing protein [FCB group bacterium]
MQKGNDMKAVKINRISTSIIFSILAGLLLLASALSAEDSFTPVYKPTLNVTRTTTEFKIDGQLIDPGWQKAAIADNFAEHRPGDQTKPPVKTEAFITYDTDKLYIAFVCYDDPSVIRASFCERDRGIGADDNICLLIDTYGDAAWAYELNVNPYGIQADAVWSNNGGEDGSYDLIWESAGIITDSGYQIEMALPFSSLRFPNKRQQTWKMDFWRNHPRDVRGQYSWAAIDRDESCWPCQWGTVTGIENVQPGKGIEILPTYVAHQSGALSGDGSTEKPFNFDSDDGKGDFSLGAKYAITSDAVIEASYNPDFSQVEADAAQIDVNSLFALFYSEKRPFFQEGSDLFNTLFTTVYTRSINDPQFATKTIARMNRTSIAYMAAYDENSPIILPFEENSEYLLGGKSVSNILRMRRTFGENSRLGMILTDRRMEDDGYGTLFGFDGSFQLTKNNSIYWQAIGSYTEELDDPELSSEIGSAFDTLSTDPLALDTNYFDNGKHTVALDGDKFSGRAFFAGIDHEGRNIYFDLDYKEISPTFRADNGFEPRNNERSTSMYTHYKFYSNNDWLDYVTPSVMTGAGWNFDGTRKDAYVRLAADIKFKFAQLNIHPFYQRESERLGGILFDKVWLLHFCTHATPSNVISFGGSINYGHKIARRDLVMGKYHSHSFWIDIKPLNRLLIENWFDFTQSHDIDTGEELFKGYIVRSRLNLQLSREITLRVVAQYDDFYQCWDIDPLLTYRLSPFSVFYMGSSYNYQKYEGLGANELGKETRLDSRQFFLKLQYLFQA